MWFQAGTSHRRVSLSKGHNDQRQAGAGLRAAHKRGDASEVGKTSFQKGLEL